RFRYCFRGKTGLFHWKNGTVIVRFRYCSVFGTVPILVLFCGLVIWLHQLVNSHLPCLPSTLSRISQISHLNKASNRGHDCFPVLACSLNKVGDGRPCNGVFTVSAVGDGDQYKFCC